MRSDKLPPELAASRKILLATKEETAVAMTRWCIDQPAGPAKIRTPNYLLVLTPDMFSNKEGIYQVSAAGYRNKLDDDDEIAFGRAENSNNLTDDYRQSKPDFVLEVKWNKCSDLRVNEGGWLHFCSDLQVDAFSFAIIRARFTAELMIDSWIALKDTLKISQKEEDGQTPLGTQP